MTGGQLISLAWRESRFARRRLFLFLSAISLGVAALVAVQGFASNLQREIRNEARAMLGADVRLASRQSFGTRTEEIIDSLLAANVEVARVTSFNSMAVDVRSGATRLVQARAPESGFPFYGEITTDPVGRWEALHTGRNVVVDPALLVALGIAVGDTISLGLARFEVAAAIRKLPGDVEVASAFAPRVFLPADALTETGLLGIGARVEYEAFLRLPDAEMGAAFVRRHETELRQERVRARTVEDQQQRMEEALGRLSDYLGLVGVFALLLGGIGVASAMGAYMARKAESVAVLRCLGATARQVFGVYLLQAAMMGLAGALVGVTLGAGVQWVLPRMLEGFLPVDVRIRVDGVAVLTGIVVGVWTAVVFALLPLLQVRRVSPLSAIRKRVEPLTGGLHDPWRTAAWLVLAASVLLLVMYQAGQPLVGFAVAAGIATTLLVLWLSAHWLTRTLRRLPRAEIPYPLRQGLANLYRPGNQTVTVVLALGFGVFLIATLLLTQATILRPLEVDAEGRGNLILFDVQEDQVAGVQDVLAQSQLATVQSAPIIPMRVAAINGLSVRPVGSPTADLPPAESGLAGADEDDEQRDGRPGGWATRREYRSTYRDTAHSSERIVSGRWFDDRTVREPGVFEVSMERDVASELGVGIGDRIEWDVLGVPVLTEVTSLRQVDWARFEPNFFAVFEPDALANAPQMWVFLVRAEEELARAAVQREIVARYPNISALDLTLVQGALDDVVNRISLVIRFLAGFSVATGFIVLLGAIATGRLQRIRESVLLKTLGATRRQIATILLTEYALLGSLAVLVGSVLALVAGWGLARWLFTVPLAVEPAALLGLAGGIILLSAAIGLSASRDVFASTPMEALREE